MERKSVCERERLCVCVWMCVYMKKKKRGDKIYLFWGWRV